MGHDNRLQCIRESYRLIDEADRRVSVFSNGLTAIVSRHDAAPLAAVRVYVRGGSVFEGRWTGTGISHLLEHVVTGDGTASHTERELLELGDAIGGMVNAYTSVDHICHHVVTAREHCATAIEMFADYVVRPLLSPAIFERELGVVQRELERDRDDPDTQLEEMLHELLYRGHPMQYPVIGHREGLMTLTHQDLVEYNRRVQTPENVAVVVVGDVEIPQVMECIGRAFRGFQRGPRFEFRLPEPAPVVAPIRAVQTRQVEAASLTVAWLTVCEADRDDTALDLLSSILLEGDHARLVRSLRWDGGLVHDIAGTHDSSWHTPGAFQVSARCDADRRDAVVDGVLQVIGGLDQQPISDSELARAKTQNLTALLFQRETAEGLAALFGEDFLATGNADYSAAYERRIREATAGDLMRAAKQYLRPNSFALAAVVPKGRAAQRPTCMTAHRPERPVEWQLSNGLTCLLRPMHSSSFTAVNLCFPGGLLAEGSEDNGVFNLMAQCLIRGTKDCSGDEIAERFASQGSHLRSIAGLNQVNCGFAVPSGDLESLVEIMADVLAKPAFDSEELGKIKPAVCDAIARFDEDWQVELMRFARRCFFEFSPYRMSRLGTIESVTAMTADTLRSRHRRYICAANGVLAITGDIEPDRARAILERYFGGMPRGERAAKPDIEREPARESDRLFVKRAADDREVAGLFIGFRGLSLADRQHRAAIVVFETMLAGYSLSGGRLYSALRGGDRDMVYEVSGESLIGVLPGYIAFIAGCEPDRVNDVYRIIRREIDEVRAGRFDEAELERARNMVAAGELDILQTTTDFAVRMSVDAALGLSAWDWEAFLQEVRGVRHDDLIAAADAYLTASTIIVVTPEPESVELGLEPSEARV